MLFQAVSLLREELNHFILQQDPAASNPSVILGNIAFNESDDDDTLKDKLVMTIINLQEDETLRNVPPIKRQAGTGYEVLNPPLYINLYVLISANWPDAYADGLKRLEQVLQFFQSRRIFNVKQSSSFSASANLDDPDLAKLQLTVDLESLTIEQINHLWGTLGGKQLPAMLFRVRCAEIQLRQPQGTGVPITEIQGKL